MADEAALVGALRSGDELAFVALVDRYHGPLLRLACTFVPSRAVAEEVVQETWLGVVRGIAGFEGRSSLQTWLYRILCNRARTAAARERRTVPLDEDGPAVDPGRFRPDGGWERPPSPWTEAVEERLAAAGVGGEVRRLIETLPAAQRRVISLRDVDGLSAPETCAALGITEGNQRVLLHRARSRIRGMLEGQLGET